MPEAVYEFLKAMGFTRDELHMFQDENEEMYFTNMVEIKKNIVFLVSKGLSEEEIMDVFRVDPFMFTVKNNRLDALDKIYIDDLSMDKESLKQLIIMNPDTYISSPIQLNQNIQYLMEHNYTIVEVRQFFIRNPHLVSMSPTKFVNAVEAIVD